MEVKSCEFCKKRQGRRCQVLTEMIGWDRECWAWSDDPQWEAKVKAAVKEYAAGRMPEEDVEEAG